MRTEKYPITKLSNRNLTTSLRGIAILIIMIGHVGVSGFNCRVFNPCGGIGVAMFLFLSGYGICESYKCNGLKLFWTKKVLRIFVPYILWIPLYHAIMRLSPLAPSIEIPLFPSYWFIWYIFIWYLIFYIVFRFLSQNCSEIMCGIAIVLFLLFPNLQAEQSLSFIAGVLISMHKDRFCKIEKKHILTIGIGLFLFGVSILWIKQMPFIREYELESFLFKCLNLLLKLSIGISLVLLFLCIRYKCNRYIIFCGKISYELYLVHFFFYVTIANNIQNLALFLVQSFVLAFLLFSISSNIKKRFNHKT